MDLPQGSNHLPGARRGLDIATICVVLLTLIPVAAGLAGTALPAFGYLPVLGESRLSMEPLADLLSRPGLAWSVALSYGTGLIASICSLGLVLFFAAGWSGTRTFQRVSRFLSPILSVPHAAAAIGLAFLVAPSGFLVRLVSPWATGWTRPPDLLLLNDPLGVAMTAGLILKEVPFLFLMTLAALNRPGIRELTKAGASLGYGRMATFFKFVLPQIYPLIRLPVLAVIAYSTSVVDVAVILGPTTPAPLAPRIIGWMNDPDLSMRLVASAGALLQLLVTAVAMASYLGIERFAVAIARDRLELGSRHKQDAALRFSGLGLMIAVISAMVMSLVVLVLWAMAKSWWFPAPLPQSWNSVGILAQLADSTATLRTTVTLGVMSAGIGTSIALWLLKARTDRQAVRDTWLTTLVFLPLLLPQISFLFGIQVLFLSLDLGGSLLSVLLAHLVFVFPYAYLALSDPWKQQDPRYAQIAASFGASRIRIFFYIQVPLLIRPILVTFAVALAVSVGQYLPTAMIGAGRIVTVTTESVALASGGNRPIAALYAVLQLVIPVLGFAIAALLPAVLFRHRSAMRLAPD